MLKLKSILYGTVFFVALFSAHEAEANRVYVDEVLGLIIVYYGGDLTYVHNNLCKWDQQTKVTTCLGRITPDQYYQELKVRMKVRERRDSFMEEYQLQIRDEKSRAKKSVYVMVNGQHYQYSKLYNGTYFYLPLKNLQDFRDGDGYITLVIGNK